MIGMRDEPRRTSRQPGSVLPLSSILAVTLARNNRLGWRLCLSLPAAGGMSPLAIGASAAGNMRLAWNMPSGILFLTTRSPRIAAFLSGTGNHKLSEIHA
jgi:hypothetical protein